MKKLIVLTLALMLAAAGCGTGNSANSSQPVPPESSSSEVSVSEAEPSQGETPEETESTPEEEAPVDPLANLTKDQYEGLSVTAAVLQRMAILPGTAVPVTVVIKNEGESTLFYTQGSGTSEVPQALLLQSDSLQPVIPKGNLGVMTMDFVTKELKPGEELKFVVDVMTIQPNEKFDEYTYDLFNKEQTYIAEVEWPELQQSHADLVAVEPGSYTVNVSFLYTVADENGEGNPFGEPTGYAQAECLIGVS